MSDARPPQRTLRWPFVVGGVVGVLLFSLVAVRLFVLEPYRIPSGSMLPTLAVGDHLVVNRLARSPVRRGEVIAFPYPEHPDQDFVKRVIATGADVLEVQDGHPILNGWKVPSCKVGEWSYDDADSPTQRHVGDVYVEFLEQAAYLTFYDRVAGGFPDHQGPFHAKSGEVWVMGDNRNNSHDSRMWFGGQGGGLPADTVKGEVTGTSGPPKLPPSMASLAGALDACMRSQPPPSGATPPAPK